jgi:hypothetical protein
MVLDLLPSGGKGIVIDAAVLNGRQPLSEAGSGHDCDPALFSYTALEFVGAALEHHNRPNEFAGDNRAKDVGDIPAIVFDLADSVVDPLVGVLAPIPTV